LGHPQHSKSSHGCIDALDTEQPERFKPPGVLRCAWTVEQAPPTLSELV